jgi:hypothetical protein
MLLIWFLRDWIVLEFIKSKSVKVLFRDPNTKITIMKDLKKNILIKKNDFLIYFTYYITIDTINKTHDKNRDYGFNNVLYTLWSRYIS